MSVVRMTSSDEAIEGVSQHKRPCHDCPMRRIAIRGWLGGATPNEYKALCHSDAVVDCHAIRGQQCAGVAIYRRNVCKFAYPPNLRLPADRESVFATPAEFLAHHETP